MMNNPRKILQKPCVDVYPKKDFGTAIQNLPTSAIFLDQTIWRSGQTGKITITFKDKDAAWSNIGNQSTHEFPSMNLGWLDPPFEDFEIDGKVFSLSEFKNQERNYCSAYATNPTECCSPSDEDWCNPNTVYEPGATIIHEFGHALGMMHEHQNDLTGQRPIKFDHETVYSEMASSGWDQQTVQTNIIDRYECLPDQGECPYSGSEFDKSSIMLYALPNHWLTEGAPLYANYSYSKLDTEWLQMKYPLTEGNPPQIDIEFIDGSGEPDWKKNWVKKVIKEKLEPIVGINFTFSNLPDLVKESVDPVHPSTTEPSTTESEIPITTEPPSITTTETSTESEIPAPLSEEDTTITEPSTTEPSTPFPISEEDITESPIELTVTGVTTVPEFIGGLTSLIVGILIMALFTFLAYKHKFKKNYHWIGIMFGMLAVLAGSVLIAYSTFQ